MAGSGTKKRTSRTVEIADHLWERLEAMALEMGAERDALVNQALHAFAREHGYLKPGELASVLASAPPDDNEDTKSDQVPDLKIAEAAAMKATGSGPRVPVQTVGRGSTDVTTSLTAQLYRAPERPDRGGVGSTAKIKAHKEAKRELTPAPAPPPAAVAPPPEPEPAPDSGPVPDYFPSEITGSEIAALPKPPERGGDRTVVGKPAERKLFVVVDGKITQEVVGARYVIGRDTACQLALPSNRISRQHVVVLKDGAGFAIEDMGSSNGTWLKNERISRRPVQHGEEYVIGDITLRFEYR